MQRILVLAGLVLLLTAALWPWLSRWPLGHLPGDIVVVRPGFRFYFPLTTLIIISVVVSLIARLWRR